VNFIPTGQDVQWTPSVELSNAIGAVKSSLCVIQTVDSAASAVKQSGAAAGAAISLSWPVISYPSGTSAAGSSTVTSSRWSFFGSSSTSSASAIVA